jgi:hypothetical protein
MARSGILLGLLVAAGCTSIYEVPYADAVHEGREALRSEKGWAVQGYVDADEGKERWSGRAFLERDGAITFVREDVEPETVRVPRKKVKAILVRRLDGKKVAMGGVYVLGAAAFAVGAAAAGLVAMFAGV